MRPSLTCSIPLTRQAPWSTSPRPWGGSRAAVTSPTARPRRPWPITPGWPRPTSPPRSGATRSRAGADAPAALGVVLTDDALRGQMQRAVQLGMIGDPEDVAAAVLFLAAPASGYITGKVLEVDGGMDRPNLDLGLPDL